MIWQARKKHTSGELDMHMFESSNLGCGGYRVKLYLYHNFNNLNTLTDVTKSAALFEEPKRPRTTKRTNRTKGETNATSSSKISRDAQVRHHDGGIINREEFGK